MLDAVKKSNRNLLIFGSCFNKCEYKNEVNPGADDLMTTCACFIEQLLIIDMRLKKQKVNNADTLIIADNSTMRNLLFNSSRFAKVRLNYSTCESYLLTNPGDKAKIRIPNAD